MEISMIPDERGHRGQRCPAVYPTFGLGGGRGVEEGGEGWIFFRNKNHLFLFLLIGWMAEWWWEIQEERKSLGGTSRVEEETQINEV